MSESKDERAEEIIIIRRGDHGGDDHHHGGVWKIAYADFMTAMMAFFLVMWLINASNRATREGLASYFNPIKLTDMRPLRKGLKDPHKDADLGADPSKQSVADDAKELHSAGGEMDSAHPTQKAETKASTEGKAAPAYAKREHGEPKAEAVSYTHLTLPTKRIV